MTAVMAMKVAKYRAPASQPEDPLAEGRGDGGNEDEHGHHERHEACHFAARVLIAHQGDGHDARSRDPDSLQDTAPDHHLEGGREDAHETPGHEEEKAGLHGRLAPDAIR